jgi:hypothetical protein
MSNSSGSFSVHSDSVSQAYITQSVTEEQKKAEKAKEQEIPKQFRLLIHLLLIIYNYV